MGPSTESVAGPLQGERDLGASMGPSNFVDGEETPWAMSPSHTVPLQWGRRTSSTESHPVDAAQVAEESRLQWGRRTSSTERIATW